MGDDLAYADILERLAPCGLDCERCVMCEKGRVRRFAAGLIEALEGFENMAPRVADRYPAFENYKAFTEIVAVFGAASCAGCREGGSALPFCAARTCFREQGVDFCHQCAEYPCQRNSYPESIEQRWLQYNDRMREVGVEQYYRESLELPRYG